MNEDTYCYNCGEERFSQHIYIGNFAGTCHYECKTCGENFTGSDEED